MPEVYTLTIKNMTGAPQDYAFFSSPPIVSGSTSGPLWSNVMKSANHTPDKGSAQLKIWSDYYAICGSSDGDPEDGSAVIISKSVQISLGSKINGNISKGSTINLTVADDKTAVDLGLPTTPGGGKIGNFMLTTPADRFTILDAKKNNLLVGIASSKDGSITNAMGTFTPFPGSTYQISPSSVFHVSSGKKFDAGALVHVEQIGSTMAVDFVLRESNNITLKHNDQLEFEFV